MHGLSKYFRFRHGAGHPSRKLVTARSSAQLGTLDAALPLLNQIHEESEEGAGSPGEVPAVPRSVQGCNGVGGKD